MEPNANVKFSGASQPSAANGLAIVRVTVGAMFVWVFFENLGKGLYTPAGYAGLIGYYIKNSHCPEIWRSVMALAAKPCRDRGPTTGSDRNLARVLLVIGLLTRPAAFVAFMFLGSLWISEWGTSWIWELLVPVLASPGARYRTAPAANGALTHGCRNGGHLLRGGDWAWVSGKSQVRVSVIIPTHNEAQSIARVLADLPSDLTTEVIVVDSNSTDGTPQIAADNGSPCRSGTAPRLRTSMPHRSGHGRFS